MCHTAVMASQELSQNDSKTLLYFLILCMITLKCLMFWHFCAAFLHCVKSWIWTSLNFLAFAVELNMPSAEIMWKNFSASAICATCLIKSWGKTIITVDKFCTLEFVIPQENYHVMQFQLADEDKRLNWLLYSWGCWLMTFLKPRW